MSKRKIPTTQKKWAKDMSKEIMGKECKWFLTILKESQYHSQQDNAY